MVNRTQCGCQPQRYMAPNRGTQEYPLPLGSRDELRRYIDEVSFAAYDTVLYLDTHPDCIQGQRYYQENSQKRSQALREYARLYGPLQLSQIPGEGCAGWDWAEQKWPWEGGDC